MIMEKRDGGARNSSRLEGRDGSVWRAYTIYQRTQEDIAEEFGISQVRVSQIITDTRASIPTEDMDVMRRESIELYRELQRRALEIVDLVPAPVFVGKDGSIAYDDHGELVRDYTGRLRAIETAAKMGEHTRKLMGVDSAIKQELSGTISYEIVGVDPEELS
jgi:transcriptional regulator with XRE-family HTH domain